MMGNVLTFLSKKIIEFGKRVPKNCPFCGSKADLVSTTFGDNPTEYYRVQCFGLYLHCLDQWDDTELEAIESWNERPEEKKLKR